MKILTIALLLSLLPLAQVKTTATVDVPMLFNGTTPAVEVMVNGQGPFRFSIDTGAQGSARIDTTLVEKLKLPVVDQIQAGDGSGNTRSLDVVMLASIKLGDIEFKDVRAASRDYNVNQRGPKIDGILGFNLFSEHLLTLDFPAKRVRVHAGQLGPVDGKEIIAFESPRGIPVVEMTVGSAKLSANLDSGNRIGGFVLPTAVVDKLELAAPAVTIGKARTVSSEVEIKRARLKENIRLGGFEFPTPEVTFPALSNVGNIGSAVMSEFRFTFDQKNKRLQLQRQAPDLTRGKGE